MWPADSPWKAAFRTPRNGRFAPCFHGEDELLVARLLRRPPEEGDSASLGDSDSVTVSVTVVPVAVDVVSVVVAESSVDSSLSGFISLGLAFRGVLCS